jgi:hypothetical protein
VQQARRRPGGAGDRFGRGLEHPGAGRPADDERSVTAPRRQVVPHERGDPVVAELGHAVGEPGVPGPLARGQIRQDAHPVHGPSVTYPRGAHGVEVAGDHLDPVGTDLDDRGLAIRAHGRDDITERGLERPLIPLGLVLPGVLQPRAELLPHFRGQRTGPQPSVQRPAAFAAAGLGTREPGRAAAHRAARLSRHGARPRR